MRWGDVFRFRGRTGRVPAARSSRCASLMPGYLSEIHGSERCTKPYGHEGAHVGPYTTWSDQ